MRKIFYTFFGFLGAALLLTAFYAQAVGSPFGTPSGGTGTSTPSGILYGDNGSTNVLHTVTIGSGCTFSGGTLSCPGTGGGTFPFTPTTWGSSAANSTSTLIGFTQGLYSLASSTFMATSTLNGAFFPTGDLNVGMTVATSSRGAVKVSSAFSGLGTSTGITLYNTADQYTNPEYLDIGWSGNFANLRTGAFGSGTNRNLSIGTKSRAYIIDENGAQGFFYGYTNSTGSNSSVVGIKTTRTNSQNNGAELLINPILNLSGSGSYTAIKVNPTETTLGTGQSYLLQLGTSTNANLFTVDNVGNATTTALFGANLTSCNGGSNALTWNNGQFGCNSISGGSGTFSWTPTTFGSTAANSTSTLIGFTNGLYSTASSTFMASTTLNGAFFPTGDLNVGMTIATSSGGAIKISKAYSGAGAAAATSSGIALYNTDDQSTNFERLMIGANISGANPNVFQILSQNGGAGTIRTINIGSQGREQLRLSNSSPYATLTAGSSIASTITRLSGSFTNSSGQGIVVLVDPSTISQTGTAGYSALQVKPTETTLGSGTHYLLELGTSTNADLFTVDNWGNATSSGVFNVTGAYASTTNFFANGLTTCNSGNFLQWSGGTFGCAAPSVSGSVGNWFVPASGWGTSNSTSTLIGFTQGLYATASSTIGDGTASGGLTINGSGTSTNNFIVLNQLRVFEPTQLGGSGGVTLNHNTVSGQPVLAITGFNSNSTAQITWSSGSVRTLQLGNTSNSATNANFLFGASATNPLVQNFVGIGTSSPFAALSIHANQNDTRSTLFAIGSSTPTATTTLFQIDNTGTITTALGNCSGSNALTTSSGVIQCGAISGGSGVFPFTPAAWGNSTSTVIGFTQGGIFNASTTLSYLAGTAAGSFVAVDPNGNLIATTTPAGGSGTPAGSNMALQYNDLGAFGGSTGLVWDKTNNIFAIGSSTPWFPRSLTLSSTTPVVVHAYKPATSTNMVIGVGSSTEQIITYTTSNIIINVSAFGIIKGTIVKTHVETCGPPTGTGGSITWQAETSGVYVSFPGGVQPGATAQPGTCDDWYLTAGGGPFGSTTPWVKITQAAGFQ